MENSASTVVFVFATIINFVLSWIVANVAKQKGRSWIAFFLLSIVVSAILMSIVVASIRPSRTSPSDSLVEVESFQTCKFCAEKIKVEAIKCRYCGSDLGRD